MNEISPHFIGQNVIGVKIFLRFLAKKGGLIRPLYHYFNSFSITIYGISQ